MGYNFFSSFVSIIGNTVFYQLCNRKHYSVIFPFSFIFSTLQPNAHIIQNLFSSFPHYTHAHTYHKTCILCNLFLFLVNCIAVYLLYNTVLVSAVQQSESIIHIHIPPLFQISFPFRLPQSTESTVLYNKFASVIYFIHSRILCWVSLVAQW